MTMPSPETREREKIKLWVTDAQLIRRLKYFWKMTTTALESLNRLLPVDFAASRARGKFAT